MRSRVLIAALACAVALVAPASTLGARSVGSHAQIAWVRSAASRFVAAERSGDGAAACGVLDASLRATLHHRSCAQRWDEKLAALLRQPGARASLRADASAISSARVVVDGGYAATIDLPSPLMDGRSSFVWSESCWMLHG